MKRRKRKSSARAAREQGAAGGAETGRAATPERRTPGRPNPTLDEGQLPEVWVSDRIAESLRAGHPWIYDNQLREPVDLPAGTWVRIRCKDFAGTGLFDPTCPIRVRVFGRKFSPSAEWLRHKVEQAQRRRSVLLHDETTSAYRLLNGEGDGLPGMVVDVYGPFAVVRLDSEALEPLLPWLVAALDTQLSPRGICRRVDGQLTALRGRLPPSRLIVSENGVRFHADLAVGQKTGLFLDHRDNRAWLGPQCRDRRVLNLYAYTGAFSLYASMGGANEIVSVDIASDALDRAVDNAKLNGLLLEKFSCVAQDVFDFLKDRATGGDLFDVVIADPPSFARSKQHRSAALKAYEKLHIAALRVLAPGGLYAAGSCTSQVNPEAFRESLVRAAVRLKRPLQIVRQAGHALDHPIALGHPEGRYLKFIALRCLL